MALGGIGGFFKNLFVGPDTPSEPQASKNLAEFSKKQFENIFPILQQAAPQLAQIVKLLPRQIFLLLMVQKSL